jgi:serine/threonine protein kinase
MDFKQNSKISHYQLLEKLGAGGMGMVYKAQDLKLDRFVALKFLPLQVGLIEEDKQRFIQEAKAASALDHPNICTIYEIDETIDDQVFISMAYYEGETLRERLDKGPLSTKDAIDLVVQVCQGLAKAHEQGIVHRDIKPANIILTRDGVAKILDFGVAKFLSKKRSTVSGSVIGTPGYMSPEQAKGSEVDHRSDIWSVGVLLFEMLTTQLPFEGKSDLSIMYAIINDPPQELSQYRQTVPDDLQNIIKKTLEKDPENRYQDLQDVISDLQILGKKCSDTEPTKVVFLSPQPTPSIAVLPFIDLSPQKDHEYFCDGLTEEIINALTHVEVLRVVSRNSAFQFKGKHLDISDIGRKLKVQFILEGSIRKAANKVRITIRLINASDGYLRWAEEYDRELSDIFAVQDEIAGAVINALSSELSKMTGLQKKPVIKQYTDDSEAYNIYLKGRFLWNKRTAESLEQSIAYFKEAIRIDPQYALAHVALADANIVLGFYGKYSPDMVMPQAIQAAEVALDIDTRLAEAHISFACAKAVYEWDWNEAEKHFKWGIELNPDYAIAHHWYAINYLTPLGRFDEAVKETIRALELETNSLVIGATVGLCYYFAKQYDEAIRYLQRTLEIDPEFAVTNFFMGRVLVQKSMFQEAFQHFQKALTVFGDSTNMLATFGHAAALAGKEDVARKVLKKLLGFSEHMYVSPYDIASIYCGLHEDEIAFSWLERAVKERAYLSIYLKVDPLMNLLRPEPRFQYLLNTVFS